MRKELPEVEDDAKSAAEDMPLLDLGHDPERVGADVERSAPDEPQGTS
jgi:hypothetical protein